MERSTSITQRNFIRNSSFSSTTSAKTSNRAPPQLPPPVPIDESEHDALSQQLFMRTATLRAYPHVENWFRQKSSELDAETRVQQRLAQDNDATGIPRAFDQVCKSRDTSRKSHECLKDRLEAAFVCASYQEQRGNGWLQHFARLGRAYLVDLQPLENELLRRRKKAEEWTVLGEREQVRQKIARFRAKYVQLQSRMEEDITYFRRREDREDHRLRLALESCLGNIRDVVSWHVLQQSRGVQGRVSAARRQQLLSMLGDNPIYRDRTRRNIVRRHQQLASLTTDCPSGFLSIQTNCAGGSNSFEASTSSPAKKAVVEEMPEELIEQQAKEEALIEEENERIRNTFCLRPGAMESEDIQRLQEEAVVTHSMLKECRKRRAQSVSSNEKRYQMEIHEVKLRGDANRKISWQSYIEQEKQKKEALKVAEAAASSPKKKGGAPSSPRHGARGDPQIPESEEKKGDFDSSSSSDSPSFWGDDEQIQEQKERRRRQREAQRLELEQEEKKKRDEAARKVVVTEEALSPSPSPIPSPSKLYRLTPIRKKKNSIVKPSGAASPSRHTQLDKVQGGDPPPESPADHMPPHFEEKAGASDGSKVQPKYKFKVPPPRSLEAVENLRPPSVRASSSVSIAEEPLSRAGTGKERKPPSSSTSQPQRLPPSSSHRTRAGSRVTPLPAVAPESSFSEVALSAHNDSAAATRPGTQPPRVSELSGAAATPSLVDPSPADTPKPATETAFSKVSSADGGNAGGSEEEQPKEDGKISPVPEDGAAESARMSVIEPLSVSSIHDGQQSSPEADTVLQSNGTHNSTFPPLLPPSSQAKEEDRRGDFSNPEPSLKSKSSPNKAVAVVAKRGYVNGKLFRYRPAPPTVVMPPCSGGPNGASIPTQQFDQLVFALEQETQQVRRLLEDTTGKSIALLTRLQKLNSACDRYLLENVWLERTKESVKNELAQQEDRRVQVADAARSRKAQEEFDRAFFREEQKGAVEELQEVLRLKHAEYNRNEKEIKELQEKIEAHDALWMRVQAYWRQNAAFFRRVCTDETHRASAQLAMQKIGGEHHVTRRGTVPPDAVLQGEIGSTDQGGSSNMLEPRPLSQNSKERPTSRRTASREESPLLNLRSTSRDSSFVSSSSSLVVDGATLPMPRDMEEFTRDVEPIHLLELRHVDEVAEFIYSVFETQ